MLQGVKFSGTNTDFSEVIGDGLFRVINRKHAEKWSRGVSEFLNRSQTALASKPSGREQIETYAAHCLVFFSRLSCVILEKIRRSKLGFLSNNPRIAGQKTYGDDYRVYGEKFTWAVRSCTAAGVAYILRAKLISRRLLVTKSITTSVTGVDSSSVEWVFRLCWAAY